MMDSITSPVQKMLTVSELNHVARQLLESHFPLFWISGEISNFTRAASGHWYFSLKDPSAQVRCIMFKGRNAYTDFTPREGDKIEARASVTLYEARGDFQLTVESIQKAGLGALFAAFEQLKQRLQQDGLFDAARKKPIPRFAKCIGIVTSADAAALRDVLSTLKRRNPGIPVVIYPTPVQGKDAAARIAEAIKLANVRAECDVLIICRGGGSLEDLWAFNEAVVAMAVADSRIPTISGVGHETDVTICDFVADQRAATPTAAAELACQEASLLQRQLSQRSSQLLRHIRHYMRQRMQTLDFLARRLVSPVQSLATQTSHIKQLKNRLNYTMQQQLYQHQQHWKQLSNSLEQLSPQAVLARGYAIVSHEDSVITHAEQVLPDQTIQVQLHTSAFQARVLRKLKN